jgi:hypothetical protein
MTTKFVLTYYPMYIEFLSDAERASYIRDNNIVSFDTYEFNDETM